MIYFAHSMRIYNTPEEQQVLEFIGDIYGRREVVCPNNDMGELGSITPYLQRIEKCKEVIVREYKGFLGRGAYKEVQHALDLDKKVQVVRGNGLEMQLLPVKGIEVNDRGDWKIKYGKLILHT